MRVKAIGKMCMPFKLGQWRGIVAIGLMDLGFGSTYGTRTGECIRSFKIKKECESCIFRPCRKQSDVSSLLSVDESRKVSKMRCGRCLCSIEASGPDCALSDRFNSSACLCLCHTSQKPATFDKREWYSGAAHVRGKDAHIRIEIVLGFILTTSHGRICKYSPCAGEIRTHTN